VIVFVRHGQTAPNRAGVLLGRSDPPLTPLGEEQATRVAAVLAREAPAAIVSSPLLRARATAEAIAGATGVGVEIDERLIEIDYGEWEGLSFAELPDGAIGEWRRNPSFAPSGGESLEQVGARVGGLAAEMLERAGEQTIVAVSHVSPIKAAVAWAVGLGDEVAWKFRLDVASLTRIAPGPVVLSFNETSFHHR
jgi:broad specificity phosphatase PhoE